MRDCRLCDLYVRLFSLKNIFRSILIFHYFQMFFAIFDSIVLLHISAHFSFYVNSFFFEKFRLHFIFSKFIRIFCADLMWNIQIFFLIYRFLLRFRQSQEKRLELGNTLTQRRYTSPRSSDRSGSTFFGCAFIPFNRNNE